MEFRTKQSGVTVMHNSNSGLYEIKTSQRINLKLAALLKNESYNRGSNWYYRINIIAADADAAMRRLFNVRTNIKQLNIAIKTNSITPEAKNNIETAEALVGLCQFGHTTNSWNMAERYHVELRNRFNITLHCN